MTIVKSDEKGLEEAAKVLLSGGVAVIPTDTVYGLAAHPKFPEAVARLYTIKGRAEGKPIALLAADAQSTGIASSSTLNSQRSTPNLLSHWPGALTIVYGGEGYRVPDHDWTRRLLARCGGLLRVTSANLSGKRAATDAEGALAEVGLSADLVVDDGISPGGEASTVVKVEEGGSLTLLREGPVKVLLGLAMLFALLVSGGCSYDTCASRLEGEDYRIMPVADYVDGIRQQAMDPQGDLSPANTTFESTASYRVIYEDARYVSFQTQEYWYGGGAHGSTRVTVGTLDRRTGRLLRVADVVPVEKHLALQALLRERAIAQLGGEDHLQGEVTVTENFYLAQDGLHFVYNQYEIACYADGIIEVILDPASLP